MPEEAVPPPPLAPSLAVDCGAGFVASVIVSPFILAIDRAIIEAAAGKAKLFSGIAKLSWEMLKQPQRALLTNPSYWMIAGVYALTYAAANSIDTLCSRWRTTQRVHATTNLIGTTAVNTTACIAKDVAFARMYGASSTAGNRMPLITIGIFGLRDLTTIASAFTLPKMLAAGFVSSGVVPEQKRAETAAQFVSPVSMQVICAPLHLLALNFYNMPVAIAAERTAAVARTAPQTMVAFAARILPTFSIGGVINATLTEQGHKSVRDWYQPPR